METPSSIRLIITSSLLLAGMTLDSPTYALPDSSAPIGSVSSSLSLNLPAPELASRLHMLERDILKLQRDASTYQESPWVVRLKMENLERDPYVLVETDSNGEKFKPNELYDQLYNNRRSTMVFVDRTRPPASPLLLPGESVVWHNMPELARTLLGKYNPALINSDLVLILQNKYAEAFFWESYVPGAMGKSVWLKSLINGLSKPASHAAELKKRLDALFPKGWVIKGVNDSATQASFIITNSIDIEKELRLYSENLDLFQEKLLEAERLAEGGNPDIYMRTIRDVPGFMGWRLKRLFKEPEAFIVQERFKLLSEYRVEVVMGEVLDDVIIPRYQYDIPTDPSWQQDAAIPKVRDAVKAWIARLPSELRVTPFGMDVATTADGRIVLIESNAGGNSGFLENDPRSMKSLNKALRRFPQRLATGEVSIGLSPNQQMTMIHQILKQTNMTLKQNFSYLNFCALAF